MDTYVYKAGLWCGSCVIKALVAARKAAPGAIALSPAEALQQIVSVNGFSNESDYDSDISRKVPMRKAAVKPTLPSTVRDAGSSSGTR
jgi:hypothetical protein